MKVILTQNVPKLGAVGDVCQVAPGFGRNYLIPQHLAILATKGALRQIDDLKRGELRRLARLRSETELLADRISAIRLDFTAHVGETGRLYGSVTASDIAEAIEEQLGEAVDRRKIILEESIRTLGHHEITMHLMPGVDATIHVEVTPSAEVVPDVDHSAAPAEAGPDAGATSTTGMADDETTADAEGLEQGVTTP